MLVEDDGSLPYAQVRMIGKAKSINNNRPDLDNGKQYKSFLSNTSNVKNYLNYRDEAGNLLMDDALRMADEKYSFADYFEFEDFV